MDNFFGFSIDFAGNIGNIAKKGMLNTDKLDQNGSENRMPTEPRWPTLRDVFSRDSASF